MQGCSLPFSRWQSPAPRCCCCCCFSFLGRFHPSFFQLFPVSLCACSVTLNARILRLSMSCNDTPRPLKKPQISRKHTARMGGFSTVSGNPTAHRKRTTKFSFVMVTHSFLRAFAIDLSIIDHTAETPESETSVRRGKKKYSTTKQIVKHLLLPSTGATMNSPAAEGFVLRSFHMQMVAGRKTFVTGYNVQPSSFVSLLLCQTLQEGSFSCSVFFPPLFGHVTVPTRVEMWKIKHLLGLKCNLMS